MSTSPHREKFAGRIGGILAAAGSAVGLGNIWRFPYLTGENGGSAFLLIYLLCVIVLCIPAMMAEFIIGRHSMPSYQDGACTILTPLHPTNYMGPQIF